MSKVEIDALGRRVAVEWDGKESLTAVSRRVLTLWQATEGADRLGPATGFASEKSAQWDMDGRRPVR